MMERDKAERGLLEVSQKIDRNIAFEALDELEVWEEKFKKWADILEEQNSQGGGQGQGQGQGEGKDITEQILALLKIRDDQGEIIGKTKVVESGNFLAKREKWTDTLNEQQNELMIDLTGVRSSSPKKDSTPSLTMPTQLCTNRPPDWKRGTQANRPKEPKPRPRKL